MSIRESQEQYPPLRTERPKNSAGLYGVHTFKCKGSLPILQKFYIADEQPLDDFGGDGGQGSQRDHYLAEDHGVEIISLSLDAGGAGR